MCVRTRGTLLGIWRVILRRAIAFGVIGIAPKEFERDLLRRQVVEVVIRTSVPPVAAALRHAVLLVRGVHAEVLEHADSRMCPQPPNF
jgi:hypothetical protein